MVYWTLTNGLQQLIGNWVTMSGGFLKAQLDAPVFFTLTGQWFTKQCRLALGVWAAIPSRDGVAWYYGIYKANNRYVHLRRMFVQPDQMFVEGYTC